MLSAQNSNEPQIQVSSNSDDIKNHSEQTMCIEEDKSVIKTEAQSDDIKNENTKQNLVISHFEVEDNTSTRQNSKFYLIKFRYFKSQVKNRFEDIKMKTSAIKHRFVSNQYFMLIMIILAAGLGIGMGFGLRQTRMSDQAKVYFGFPGELFVRALKFITLPLYFCKLVTGVVNLKRIKRKKMAFQTVILFSISLITSIMVGFLLALTIKPGSINKKINITFMDPFPNNLLTTSDTILDIFR